MDELTREFLMESQEGLDRMVRCLTDLESRPEDTVLLTDIFRSVHTIKGATGFLGFKRLEKLAHAGENLLGLLRDGKLAAKPHIITGLLALLDGLPTRNIVRFFDHEGEHWTIKPEIRAICRFRQANLCQTPLPFSEKFDIVFLRNVMLYFSQESRSKVLAEAHRLLAPDGALFLGSSEQPADTSLWTPMLQGGTCYFTPKPPAAI